jgi:hypothetical protein
MAAQTAQHHDDSVNNSGESQIMLCRNKEPFDTPWGRLGASKHSEAKQERISTRARTMQAIKAENRKWHEH